jgi:hypothetical protein
MTSTTSLARQAGALYFLFMVVAICSEFLYPQIVVSGDAAATARNIAADEFIYRGGILLGLVTHLIFLFLVVRLYTLFEPVDRSLSMLMVVLVAVGVAAALTNTLGRFAPLSYVGGAEHLTAFTPAQREALAMASISTRRFGNVVPMMFWGLWLFPFGLLVIRSTYFPRALGWLLFVAGTAYCVTSVTGFLWPTYRGAIFRYMTPLYMGEVPIIFWMMIKGARTPAAAT